jgi:hypothetical protein
MAGRGIRGYDPESVQARARADRLVTVTGEHSGRAGDSFRILIANEPYAYRDALCTVLRMLRPDLDIRTPHSADLGAEVELHAPHLVVCSCEPCVLVGTSQPWVLLNPAGSGRAVLSLDSVRDEVNDIDFQGLLALIGHVERATPPCASRSPIRP